MDEKKDIYYNPKYLYFSKYITYSLIVSLIIVLIYYYASTYYTSLDKMQYIKYM